MPSPLVRKVVVPAIVSYACVLLIGGIFYQDRIFHVSAPAFVFTVYGAIFSSFLFFFRYHRRNALALLVVLYLLNEVIVNRQVGFELFGRDLIYIGLLGAGTAFYVAYFNRSKAWNHLLAPLVLGFLFLAAIMAGLAVLYVWWSLYLTRGFVEYLEATLNVFVPSVFLVGLGIGFGVLLDERGLTEFLARQWKAVAKYVSG